MFRNLKAIEIAEGALLADIAVVFQVISTLLPVGASFLRLFCFVVFAILVLRRGMYVGVMGMCVAIFLVGVLLGPQRTILMLLEGTGGIFLGITMRRRFPHFVLLFLGVVGGTGALYFLLLLLSLLTGQPLSQFVVELHRTYNAFIPLANSLATHLGLAAWWQHDLFPTVSVLASLAFTYWWAAFYLALCLFMCPVVFCVYLATNVFVRLLGYDVRPFPDGRLGRLLQRASRRLIRIGIKYRIIGRSGARA